MSKNIDINLRKNIISFAWTWIGLLVFIGIISLFSIWSMNRTFNNGAELAFKTSALKNEISSASIAFKVQIQEWKNILLRGKNKADRDTYFSKFEDQEKSVQASLNRAHLTCSGLALNEKCTELRAIQMQHEQLGVTYKKMLMNAPLENYEDIHKVDQAVKGLDRDLEKNMSALNKVFSEIELKQHQKTNQELADKYADLRKLILSILGIALTISGISLYSVLRVTSRS